MLDDFGANASGGVDFKQQRVSELSIDNMDLSNTSPEG